jgi:hypothetical protein
MTFGTAGHHRTCTAVRPLCVLQQLGGWESPEMVRRYAHFSGRASGFVRGSPMRLARRGGSADGTFTAQSVNDEGAASLRP